MDCKKCQNRERADQLIEKLIREKNSDRKSAPEKETFDYLNNKYGVENSIPGSRTFEQQFNVLTGEKIPCPKCKACDRTEPKKFNLMFKTQQ